MLTGAPVDELVTYPCAHCGAANRIPRARLRDDPKCGRCHDKVFPRTPVAVTTSSWNREVEECPLPVLIDFWAPWCGPCHAVAPVLEQIAQERGGRIKVAKVNVDENPGLAARYGIRSIPTILLVKQGKVADQVIGAVPKVQLKKKLDALA